MGYVAPTWQNGGPPALNAKNMQDISDDLAYVSNHMVNPKLLENWYFGNPVDQRGGYIQLGGTMMYKDAACTEQFGVSSGTTPVKVYATYARPIDNGVELALYIPLSSIVRGYTGIGYGIDRWKLDIGESVTIDNGLNIVKANSYVGQYFDDFDKFIGRQLVGSVLMSDGDLYTGTFVYNGVVNQGQTFFSSSRLGMYIQKLSNALTQVEFNTLVDNVKVLAVGLELGSQQTLAHQDANGAWVLNEIPKFGDQLAECQRYFVRINNVYASGNAAYNNIAFVDFATPVPLRTNPVLTVRNKGLLSSAGTLITPSEIQLAAREENHIYLGVTTPATLTANQPVCLHDASIDLSADL